MLHHFLHSDAMRLKLLRLDEHSLQCNRTERSIASCLQADCENWKWRASKTTTLLQSLKTISSPTDGEETQNYCNQGRGCKYCALAWCKHSEWLHWLLFAMAHLVPHELFAAVMLGVESPGHKGVHLGPLGRWYAVPDLWSSIVQVVQTVQVHVFCVPVISQPIVTLPVQSCGCFTRICK